ncbi:MAG: hypothetical protein KGJ80_15020, partial [Chloroflexota bacterium]|nr:hypothetical protein [Chloroflexota bacterium]
SALDFAWIRVIDGSVNIDRLVIALTAAFSVICGVMLLRTVILSEARGDRRVIAAFIIAAALSLFSIYRYSDDPRLGSGYPALLQRVQRDAQPRDVLILNDDAQLPLFLDENRARLRWYGLSRDPKQWDDATRALLTRLSQQYARVWFAFDDATAQLPDPTRDWLAASLQEVARQDFEDGVHLILFDQKRP